MYGRVQQIPQEISDAWVWPRFTQAQSRTGQAVEWRIVVAWTSDHSAGRWSLGGREEDDLTVHLPSGGPLVGRG